MTRSLFRYLITVAVIGLCSLPLGAAGKRVVIVQTNSAGDNVHLIDPTTNKVVGVIKGIEVNHGAAVAPDGTRIYISDEAAATLAPGQRVASMFLESLVRRMSSPWRHEAAPRRRAQRAKRPGIPLSLKY